MKNIYKVILPLTLIMPLIGAKDPDIVIAPNTNDYATVRFLNNAETIIKTQSGMDALAFNTVVHLEQVPTGEKVVQPELELKGKTGYIFEAWYTEIECINQYDFNLPVTRNLTLYANYVRDESQSEDEYDYTEPTFEYVEKVDNNALMDIQFNGILNMPLQGSSVDMSTYGINLLTKHKDNCIQLVNYVRKDTVTDLAATYANNKVTITYKVNGTEKMREITVNKVNYTVTSSSTYENKAAKYEAVEKEPYSIIMGGSSSMENWATSTADMKGMTTYNVGIGGTKVEEWDGILNERLVYPASPRAVVYYLGINNIINGSDTGEIVGRRLTDMFTHVHEHLPESHIYFILINYVPGYMQHANEITTANNIVKNFSADKEYITLIDAGELLMKPNGQPSWAYFRTDGLHMSLSGYVIWGGEVRRVVIETEKKLYGDK